MGEGAEDTVGRGLGPAVGNGIDRNRRGGLGHIDPCGGGSGSQGVGDDVGIVPYEGKREVFGAIFEKNVGAVQEVGDAGRCASIVPYEGKREVFGKSVAVR